MLIGRVIKETNDVREVPVDFSRWLDTGELIGRVSLLPVVQAASENTSSWSLCPTGCQPTTTSPPPQDTTPLVVQSIAVANGGTQVTLEIGVGTPGLAYIVSFIAVSDLTQRQKEIDILVIVTASLNAVAVGAPPVTDFIMGTTVLPQGFAGHLIVQNTSGAAITVTLPPSPTVNQEIDAVDSLGNAGTFTVTWQGDSGATINGQSTYVFNTDYQAAKFLWTGSQWVVL